MAKENARFAENLADQQGLADLSLADRQATADSLWSTGHREKAAGQYWEILRLNPRDDLDVRYSLAAVLLDLGRDRDLSRLLSQYEGDQSATWAFTKVLLAFREERGSRRTRELLLLATEVNKYVVKYLLGDTKLKPGSRFAATGDMDEEALAYAIVNRRNWLNTPGAISWLRATRKAAGHRGLKRRLPWSEVKPKLLHLPQRAAEVWQVSSRPGYIAAEGSSDEDYYEVIIILNRADSGLLGIEVINANPTPEDQFEYLVHMMLHPIAGGPYRPAKIEVCSCRLQSACVAMLEEIGIECSFNETLEICDQVDKLMGTLACTDSEEPEGEAASPEDLRAFPQHQGETWQVGILAAPTRTAVEEQSEQGFVVIGVERSTHRCVVNRTVSQVFPAGGLWEAIVEAIQYPMGGHPRRPEKVEVGSVAQLDTVGAQLEQVGVKCVVVDRLEEIEGVRESWAGHFGGRDAPPSLLEVPGVQPKHVGDLYEAAAGFYQQQPWRRIPSTTLIRVDCDKLHGGPWCALAMGYLGVRQGLALFEDEAALVKVLDRCASLEATLWDVSALTLAFGERFETAACNPDAIEEHRWLVAGPEAYPVVRRVNPGRSTRPPLAWELEVMTACLQLIPDFLAGKSRLWSRTIAVASGNLTLQLTKIGRS